MAFVILMYNVEVFKT